MGDRLCHTVCPDMVNNAWAKNDHRWTNYGVAGRKINGGVWKKRENKNTSQRAASGRVVDHSRWWGNAALLSLLLLPLHHCWGNWCYRGIIAIIDSFPCYNSLSSASSKPDKKLTGTGVSVVEYCTPLSPAAHSLFQPTFMQYIQNQYSLKNPCGLKCFH